MAAWRKPSKQDVASRPGENRALAYALRLLKIRPRTSFEVAVKLGERGYDDLQANSVVGQLLEIGLLDDERFARDWLRYRDRLRPSGEWLLRHELNEKGLDERLIQAALEQRQTVEWRREIGLPESGELERLLAEKVVLPRARRLNSDLPREKKLARLTGLLERRGFSPDVIFAAAKWALEQVQS